MSKKKKVDKPVRRKRSPKKKDESPQEMTVGKQTYTVGDVAWFVDEYVKLIRPRPLQGEITGVYPKDNIEPALGIREYASGKHRAIRARLCGWTKKEAQDNFAAFRKAEEKKAKKAKRAKKK